MTTAKPSRTVTRVRCVVCEQKFKPTRADSRYCSGACRQRAHRARAQLGDLERELEACRVRYWQLVGEIAQGRGVSVSQVVTGEAQLVDANGDVFMHGELVGHTEPHRPGWAAWGLEAAQPPFRPPPPNQREANRDREWAQDAAHDRNTQRKEAPMTDKPGLWTDAERLDACRDALAAALASQRGDIAGVLEIWNGSTNTTALLLALAELPATAMHETGRRYDATFDVEGALRDVAAVLATAEPPTQEGSPDA